MDYHKYITNCNKEIDQLLKKLQIREAVSNGLWHKYDLPYIGVSDEDRSSYKQDGRILNNYLGIYAVIDSNWEKEGRIVLFHKSINDVANQYATEKNLSPDECFASLFKIVLLHEIGHWIFHFAAIGKSFSNKFYKYIDDDLHEAIAQYITKKGINEDLQLLQLFDWLGAHQDQIYRNPLPGDFDYIIKLRETIDISYDFVFHLACLNFQSDKTKNDIDSITPELCDSLEEKNKFPRNLKDYEGFCLSRKNVRKIKFGI